MMGKRRSGLTKQVCELHVQRQQFKLYLQIKREEMMWRCTKKYPSKALTEVMIRKLRGDLGSKAATENQEKMRF